MEMSVSGLVRSPWVPLVLAALGALVVLGQAIVAITPGKADDAKLEEIKKGFFGKIIDALAAFAPIQKK